MTLEVPGTLDGIADAMRAAEAFCLKAAPPSLPRANIMTALDEVLANVVAHGSGGTGTIALTMDASDAHLTVGVTDTAAPFNPLLMPAPDTSLPLDERRIGGLGIALVRALTDELSYHHHDGRNHLTLTWRVGTGFTKDGHADS